MLALLAWSASAQTAVQDVEARQRDDASARPQPLSGPSVQFTSQRAPSNAEEILFELSAIEVVGGSAFDAAALETLYAGDIGAEVSLARVFEIAGLIQGLYRDSDYIFTRVVIPAQEIDGGVVRIEIIEALITAIVIEQPDGDIGPVRALAERMVAPLIGAPNPTGAMLERALLNINEIPGITRATAVPQADPDDARGGLQLFVNVERELVDGAFFADNRQTQGIGRGLAGATVTLNSYTDAGDTTSIAVFNSFAYQSDVVREVAGGPNITDGAFDFDERNTVQITHQRNIGSDGATVNGVALYSRTRPGDNLADAGIQGEQFLIGFGGTYPIIRSREVQFNASLDAEFFESETDVSNGQLQVADDRLRVASFALDGIVRDEAGYTRAKVAVRQGLDILNATPNPPPNNQGDAVARSRGDGRSDFTLIRGEIDRLVVFNDQLSFLGRFGGQYAFDPLLASEEYAIGGLTFGRGLDPSLFTGDHGVGLSGEMRYLQPIDIDGFQITMEAFGFAEFGKIWNKGQGEPQTAELLTLGGGVRLFLPDDFALGFEFAIPADIRSSQNIPDGAEVGDPRLYVNFSKRF